MEPLVVQSCLVATLILLGRQGSRAQEPPDRVVVWKDRMAAAWTIGEGEFLIFEAGDCSDKDHCWANNPTTPYGVLLAPLSPDEPDPDPENRGLGMSLMRSIFRLQPDEAVVLIGTTPPPTPYFSFTPYVFSRFNPFARGEPPYDDRTEVFASLGDSMNQLTLNTSGEDGVGPFGKELVVIATADQAVDRTIRNALLEAGFPETMINTLVLPRFKADGVTPLARMGYANEDDLFTIVMRIADVEPPGINTALRDWLNSSPMSVFRLRPQARAALKPFPFPPLRVPGTGTQEDPSSLLRLVRRIVDAHSDASIQARLGLPDFHEQGYLCLDYLLPCFGDCRDTPYLVGKHLFGAQDAIIVAGFNHENSGKASYVNITATRLSNGTAFFSVVLQDLQGSADRYVPRHPDRDNLWQVKFARACHYEPFCYEVTEEQIPNGDYVTVIVRAYLDPATGTTPKFRPLGESEIAYPWIIKISPEKTDRESPEAQRVGLRR